MHYVCITGKLFAARQNSFIGGFTSGKRQHLKIPESMLPTYTMLRIDMREQGENNSLWCLNAEYFSVYFGLYPVLYQT